MTLELPTAYVIHKLKRFAFQAATTGVTAKAIIRGHSE